MNYNNIDLTVQEAYTRDVGRGIARVDEATRNSLFLTAGDVIKISGKKNTVAKVLALYPTDENKKIIRFDGLIRNNCNSNIGDSVSIRKVKTVKAKLVTVTPLQSIPPIDERYISDALEGMPIIPNQNIMIPYFGGRLSFQVTDILPKINSNIEAVIVHQDTLVNIIEKKPEFPQGGFDSKRQFILRQLIKLEDLDEKDFDDLISKITNLYKKFRDKKDIQKP